MEIIIAILIVWFGFWINKNYPSKSVKTYLKKLLSNHKYGFAKLEFDIYALKKDREVLRQEHDRLIESIDAYEVQANNKENTKETRKAFEDKIEETKNVLQQIKEGIDNKDLNITVYEKQMTDLQEQKKMLEDYIKSVV